MSIPLPKRNIASSPVNMKELLSQTGQAIKTLYEESGQVGDIVETPYSIIWRNFYGCSYIRSNYEENVTDFVILESYWDSSEEGSTVAINDAEEIDWYLGRDSSITSHLFHHCFAER